MSSRLPQLVWANRVDLPQQAGDLELRNGNIPPPAALRSTPSAMPRDFRIAFTPVSPCAAPRLLDDGVQADFLFLAPEVPDFAPHRGDEEGPRASLPLPLATFEPPIAHLARRMYLDAEFRVIASLAGGDSSAAVERAARAFADTGGKSTRLGAIRGHDLLDRLEELMVAGAPLKNTVTGQAFAELQQPIVAAAARLGYEPLLAALRQQARIVFAGHASAEAMATAAVIAQLDWAPTDARLEPLRAAAGQLSANHPAIEVDAAGEVQLLGRPASFVKKGETRPAPEAQIISPGMTRVEIVYRQSFRASTILTPRSTLGAEDYRIWLHRLQKSRAPLQIAAGGVTCIGYESLETSGYFLATLQCDAPEEKEAAALLAEAIGQVGEAAEVHPSYLPHVAPQYALWPTEVPSELIEWSVDVRAAQDWLA